MSDFNRTVHLIYLEKEMLLSKKQYTNWREVQDEYWDTFKTCFCSVTYEWIIDFFEHDFGDEPWPFSKDEILNFSQSENIIIHSK